MKRLREGTSSRVALKHKRGILRERIKSLTAQGPNVDESHDHAEIGMRNKQGEEVYLRNLYHWLTMGQTKRIEHHSIEREGHENGCSSEHNERIERLEKQVQELTQQSKSHHGLAVYDQAESTTLPLPPETTMVAGKFKQNALKIIEWLKISESFISIGIYGMGGVGKSTLVTHICHQLQQDTAFSWPIYWLTASQYGNIYNLREGIAKLIGMDFLGEEDERKRAAKLQRSLAKMGNIVLVLDDMPQPFSLYEVGIPVKGSCCKIMLTTRSLEVCRKMRCGDFIIKVETLSCFESSILFSDNLSDYDSLSKNTKLNPEQCHGLPLAITTMAHHIAGVVDCDESENTWQELDVMRNCVLPNLKRSYDRLKNNMVQDCFLSFIIRISSLIRIEYCYSMRPSDLVHYWINEGSLDMIISKDLQLKKGHSIFHILLNSCLLEKDMGHFRGGTYVKMHDLIRDMGIQIIQEHPYIMYKASSELTKMPEKELWMEDLVKVSLARNHIKKIPNDMSPKCLNLTVLILSGNPLTEIPESFFLGMMGLRVLDLSNTNIERLPNSVSDLENLRELLLAECLHLTHVPPLVKLLKLRVLDLEVVYTIKKAPLGMERLRCLEKLNFNWHESDLTHFNKIVEELLSPFSMSKICYALEISGSLQWEDDGYFGPSERKMTIGGVGFGQMEDTPVLPNHIQLLQINGCTGLEHISSSMQQRPFIFLEPDTIETLVLDDLPDLRWIIVSQGSSAILPTQLLRPAGPLSKLKHLVISVCPKIRIVFPFNLVQQGIHHLSLEKINVWNCERLEEIFESGTNETNIRILHLPNLKSFHMWDVPKLRSFWMGPLQCNSLKHWEIEGACEMKQVLSLNVLECRQPLLPNLETIEVRSCERLEVVFATTNSGTNPILSLPKLRKLTLSSLPKLSSIYRGLLICTSLEEITISNCGDLRLLRLSKPLICDDSPSTLGSIPKYDADRDWWEPLSEEYPEDMHSLRAAVDEHYWMMGLEHWTSDPFS